MYFTKVGLPARKIKNDRSEQIISSEKMTYAMSRAVGFNWLWLFFSGHQTVFHDVQGSYTIPAIASYNEMVSQFARGSSLSRVMSV